jgi:hypothetical protein
MITGGMTIMWPTVLAKPPTSKSSNYSAKIKAVSRTSAANPLSLQMTLPHAAKLIDFAHFHHTEGNTDHDT